jgi:Transposase
VIVEILGIDVGKHEMHAVLLQHERSTSKSVANSAAGFKQLQGWLRNRRVERAHACLEATGGWSEDLALVLHEAGHVVSLVNPRRIKSFARSEMLRTKTDLIDAALIALNAEAALSSARAARQQNAENERTTDSFAELLQALPDLWPQASVELQQELALAFGAVLAESPPFRGLFADPSCRGKIAFRLVANVRKTVERTTKKRIALL